MSEHSSERLGDKEGPMLSDTSGDDSDGISYIQTFHRDFQLECEEKLKAIGEKLSALRAAGYAALDELKVKWEQQCNDLQERMNDTLIQRYNELEMKAKVVQEDKERLKQANAEVANLSAFLAPLQAE